MSTYTVHELLEKWKLGEVTTEQTLGYLLQNVLAQGERQIAMEKRLQQVENRLNTKP